MNDSPVSTIILRVARRRKRSGRSDLLQYITAPLGFFALALLITEGTLTLVLTTGGLKDEYRWFGFLCMIGIFVLVLLIVAGLVVFAPEKLVFGKEEHAAALTEPSALEDQIVDALSDRVKAECLKKPDKWDRISLYGSHELERTRQGSRRGARL